MRSRLAKLTLLLGVGGVVALSVTTIVLSHSEDRDRAIQLVFSSTLPLLGTWVGTILAFYFARENFDAATESTYRISRAVDGKSLVDDVMIKRSEMIVRRADDDSNAVDVRLATIADRMQASGKRRIPLLTCEEYVRFVIHDSLLDSFGREIGKSSFENETVAELVSIPSRHALATGFGCISSGSIVEQARKKMESIPGCNDIFVTETGGTNERVLGWLTNTLLATID
ncbi:hypothetical protein GCM10027089_11940 [Nocardia thraciensis]